MCCHIRPSLTVPELSASPASSPLRPWDSLLWLHGRSSLPFLSPSSSSSVPRPAWTPSVSCTSLVNRLQQPLWLSGLSEPLVWLPLSLALIRASRSPPRNPAWTHAVCPVEPGIPGPICSSPALPWATRRDWELPAHPLFRAFCPTPRALQSPGSPWLPHQACARREPFPCAPRSQEHSWAYLTKPCMVDAGPCCRGGSGAPWSSGSDSDTDSLVPPLTSAQGGNTSPHWVFSRAGLCPHSHPTQTAVAGAGSLPLPRVTL